MDPIDSLRNFFNSEAEEENKPSESSESVVYSLAQAQIAVLNALFTVSSPHLPIDLKSLFSHKNNFEVFLFLFTHADDIISQTEKQVEAKREWQRLFDQLTYDYRTFYEQLQFDEVHGRFKIDFSLS